MRTRDKLIELGQKSEFVLYRRLTEELAKKLFINKWYLLRLQYNMEKRYDLYDQVTKKFSLREFPYIFRKEMKRVVRI
jgi:hypothetical protein